MNTAKTTAQKIAKQIAREPWEILKKAPRQIVGVEKSLEPTKEFQKEPQKEIFPNSPTPSDDKIKSQRLLEAYRRELKDIEEQRLIAQLQRKISQGEEFYLEEYPQLSLEQKQVLKAQVEAMRLQESKNQNLEPRLVEPTSKKSRRFPGIPGPKNQAEKQRTRVERLLPPSG